MDPFGLPPGGDTPTAPTMVQTLSTSWGSDSGNRNLSNEWKLWSSAEAELRVNPPNVRIDNSNPEATVITVDSANRSGVLLEVVQTLTEMNMVIPYAIISSDGGWFVDVFHVTTEDGNKITDPTALARIEKMLASEAPVNAGLRGLTMPGVDQGDAPGRYAVIELSVLDRPGLLRDVTALLGKQSLSVISAATWTQHLRAALVIFVEPVVAAEGGDETASAGGDAAMPPLPPTLPPPNGAHGGALLRRDHLAAVRHLIETQLGATASLINVGTINDPGNLDLDRRLHKVLSTPVARSSSCLRGVGSQASMCTISSMESMDSANNPLGLEGTSFPSHAAPPFHGRAAEPTTPAPASAAANPAAPDPRPAFVSPSNSVPNLSEIQFGCMSPDDKPGMLPKVVRRRSSRVSDSGLRSPASKLLMNFKVTIDNDLHPGYSLVHVHCVDRSALLFDTVCVLFVSDYDVNHATIGVSEGYADMEFYVRTKGGHPIESEDMKETLKRGLMEACSRRGSRFRLELTAHDRPGLLADVTKKLAESGLTITKAEVGRNGCNTVEKFLVESDGSQNHLIDIVSMRRVCMEIGQTLLEGGHVQMAHGGGADGCGPPAELSGGETVLERYITSGWA